MSGTGTLEKDKTIEQETSLDELQAPTAKQQEQVTVDSNPLTDSQILAEGPDKEAKQLENGEKVTVDGTKDPENENLVSKPVDYSEQLKSMESFKQLSNTEQEKFVHQALQYTDYELRGKITRKLESMPESVRAKVIQDLYEISKGPLYGALEGREHEIVASMLTNMAVTQANNQGQDKASCTQTVVQAMQATHIPPEIYTSLMKQLVTTGSAKTLSGDTIKLYENIHQAINEKQNYDGPKRNISCVIFQASLMAHIVENTQYADGNPRRYDWETDRAIDITNEKNYHTGLYASQYKWGIECVTGKEHDLWEASGGSMTREQALNKIAQHTLYGPVAVEIKLGDSGTHAHHMVMVTEFNQDYVTIYNPWGHFEKLSTKEFAQMLTRALFETDRVIPDIKGHKPPKLTQAIMDKYGPDFQCRNDGSVTKISDNAKIINFFQVYIEGHSGRLSLTSFETETKEVDDHAAERWHSQEDPKFVNMLCNSLNPKASSNDPDDEGRAFEYFKKN